MPKKREEIESKYKWTLEDLYETDTAWEDAFQSVNEKVPTLSLLKETFSQNAENLYSALKKIEEIELVIERLFVYARMRRDGNSADSLYQGMTDRAMSLSVSISSALSFINPELLKKDESELLGFLNDHTQLKAEYSQMIKDLIRRKPHVLSESEEKLLSMSYDFASGAKQAFTMLNNADLKFDDIDDNGEMKEMSHAKYVLYLQSQNRQTRRNAYESMYKAFKSHINTIATIYATSVKKDVYYASVRGFDSAIQRSLHSDNVPLDVYDHLIDAIHDNLDTMYDYVALRKRVLDVDTLQMHDVYTPLVANVKNEYDYETAKSLVKEALLPLGDDYQSLLDDAYTNGWIDVYENEGKVSGAYSWGTYSVHPYVLLNHRGDLDSVYTLAHELGHAMHSWYSNNTQPYATADYTIFVAEVASTVNEVLLTHHLLNTEKDIEKRKYILNHYIDQFKGTVIRQTMFAEFEKMTHEMQENGEPLTAESLSSKYAALNKKYFGPELEMDDYIAAEWARIPHFYNAFYVYKYATGFSSAIAIASAIINEGAPAVARYKQFLKSGGSDYPLELLKIAGVDLRSGEPVIACMKEFKRALDEFKQLF